VRGALPLKRTKLYELNAGGMLALVLRRIIVALFARGAFERYSFSWHLLPVLFKVNIKINVYFKGGRLGGKAAGPPTLQPKIGFADFCFPLPPIRGAKAPP